METPSRPPTWCHGMLLAVSIATPVLGWCRMLASASGWAAPAAAAEKSIVVVRTAGRRAGRRAGGRAQKLIDAE